MSSKYATTLNLCCDENVRHSERGSVISCCLHLLEMLKHVDFTSQMISNRNTLVKRHTRVATLAMQKVSLRTATLYTQLIIRKVAGVILQSRKYLNLQPR